MRTQVALHSALINSAAPSQMASAHNRFILFVEVIRVFSLTNYGKRKCILPQNLFTVKAGCTCSTHCALSISWVVLSYTELGGNSRNVPAAVHETIKHNMGGRNLVPWK